MNKLADLRLPFSAGLSYKPFLGRFYACPARMTKGKMTNTDTIELKEFARIINRHMAMILTDLGDPGLSTPNVVMKAVKRNLRNLRSKFSVCPIEKQACMRAVDEANSKLLRHLADIGTLKGFIDEVEAGLDFMRSDLSAATVFMGE